LVACGSSVSFWAFDADLVKIFFPFQQFRAQSKMIAKSALCENHTFLPKSHPCQYHSPPKSSHECISKQCQILAMPNLSNEPEAAVAARTMLGSGRALTSLERRLLPPKR
jgi:hypothetical protein